MWAAVDFVPVEMAMPSLEKFFDEFRPLYSNGRVKYSAFKIPDHPILNWYGSRNQFHECGFFEYFRLCQWPKSFFPDKLLELNLFDPNIFCFCSPFLLGGSLAWALSNGGAYHKFARGGVEAKRLGEDAALELLGGSYDEPMAYQCGIAWSKFFHNVAWDHTYVVIDKRHQLIHALLSTDTD